MGFKFVPWPGPREINPGTPVTPWVIFFGLFSYDGSGGADLLTIPGLIFQHHVVKTSFALQGRHYFLLSSIPTSRGVGWDAWFLVQNSLIKKAWERLVSLQLDRYPSDK